MRLHCHVRTVARVPTVAANARPARPIRTATLLPKPASTAAPRPTPAANAPAARATRTVTRPRYPVRTAVPAPTAAVFASPVSRIRPAASRR